MISRAALHLVFEYRVLLVSVFGGMLEAVLAQFPEPQRRKRLLSAGNFRIGGHLSSVI